ncbi:hypothetical protein Z043_125090, partial [Scleropages formosus]
MNRRRSERITIAGPGPEHPSLALRGLPSESDCFGSMATPYFEGAAVMDMCVKTEPDDKDISHPDYCTEVQGFGAEEMHSGLHLDSDKIKTEIVLVKIMDDNADLQLRSTTEHQLIHSRQKPYKCSQCGKMFSRQSALKLHHDFHAGKKPFASGSRGDVEKGVKRKRVAHSLKLKLEVLKRLECGERQKDTAIALGLSKSTVNSIYVSREQIKARAQNVLGGDKLTKIT